MDDVCIRKHREVLDTYRYVGMRRNIAYQEGSSEYLGFPKVLCNYMTVCSQ